MIRKTRGLLPMIFVAAISMAVSSTAIAAPNDQSRRVYVNQEFGFSVAIPFYAPACYEPEEHDTGITVFLDRGDADCNVGLASRPFFSIHFNYNSAEYSAPARYLDSVCEGGRIVATADTSFGSLAKRWPAMCERVASNGLQIIRLAGEEPKRGDQKVSSVIYSAILQTRESTKADDLRTFVAALTSLKALPRKQ